MTSFHLSFSDQSSNYHLQLKEVDHTKKNSVLIDNKRYKLKGSDEAITHLNSHLKTHEFTSFQQFTAVLQEDLGPEKKETVVFEKIIKNSNNTRTPEEKTLQQWLKAFNSGNPNKMKAFYQLMVKPFGEEELAKDLNLYENVQGFNIVKILSTSPGKIEALVKEEYGFGEYAKLNIEIEPQEPHRIISINIKPTHYETGEHAPRMATEKAAIQAIQAKVNELTKNDKFSGAILITKKGSDSPLLTKSVGIANRTTQQANSSEIQYNLASMSKMFTIVGILQLIENEESPLSLDSPIGDFLPEITNEEMKKVTVRQLLTHTGGTDRIEGDYNTIMHPKGFIEVSKDRAPSFEPGTKWEYSNYGLILLGAIIENVSKKDFYQYIQENIFDKVGMKNSNYQKKTELSPNTAVGYMIKKRGFVENQKLLPIRGTPAGNSYSTVDDLNKFATAVQDGTLLNANSLKLISTREHVTNEDPPSNFAIGFMTGDHWFGHSGRYEGVNGELRIFPKAGYTVAILANRDPPAASSLADFIEDTLPLE